MSETGAQARRRLGRYAGVDVNGRPLDPEHPWNRDLPAERKALRVAEIEALIASEKENPGHG